MNDDIKTRITTVGFDSSNETPAMTAKAQQWLEIRRLEARKIEPETAKVMWAYTERTDPYGIQRVEPEEGPSVGRSYFARRPGANVWVAFADLDPATRSALWVKHRSKLAFPFELPSEDLSPDQLKSAMDKLVDRTRQVSYREDIETHD